MYTCMSCLHYSSRLSSFFLMQYWGISQEVEEVWPCPCIIRHNNMSAHTEPQPAPTISQSQAFVASHMYLLFWSLTAWSCRPTQTDILKVMYWTGADTWWWSFWKDHDRDTEGSVVSNACRRRPNHDQGPLVDWFCDHFVDKPWVYWQI